MQENNSFNTYVEKTKTFKVYMRTFPASCLQARVNVGIQTNANIFSYFVESVCQSYYLYLNDVSIVCI